MPQTYNHWIVAVSLLLAVLASYTALGLAARVADSRPRLARLWLAVGGLTLGTGIWAMHFVGMLALSMPVSLRYELGRTLASLGVAIATSWFALRIGGGKDLGLRRHLASSAVMGCGIASMHYIGMGAMHMQPAITYDPWLVGVSILIAVSASYLALGLAFSLRSLATPHAQMVRTGAAVLMGLAIAGMHYTGMAAAHFQAGAHFMDGVALEQGWMSVVVGLVTLGLLGITLLVQLFDAHLEQRAVSHARRMQAANERLDHQATHDPLTDLPNRERFMQALQAAIDGCATRPGFVVVLLIDVDRFKTVNESLGHLIGDSVLVEVARRLLGLVRSDGQIARLGGDGFLAMAHVDNPRAVARIAGEVVRSLGRPYFVGTTELHLAASVGVTTYPLDNGAVEELVSHADEAMYDAKRNGGNGYEIFVPGTTIYSLDRLALENDLWHAAQQGKLEVHYQPQVDMRSGRIVGVEALARWRHETRGWIPPGEFIEMAEASDLILQIGRWTLEQSCRQVAAWCRAGYPDFSVAVNLSARQFREPDLVSIIRGAIERHGIQPRNLEIEITESVAMADLDRATGTLRLLNEAGLQIAVDDFGTGHSSLAYLKRLPVSFLKIDQSFVRDLGSGPRGDAIVRSIVTLAQGLGMRTIAEGVETPTQLAALREFGCDRYQGFLCSPARTADDITMLLAGSDEPLVEADVVDSILSSVG